MLRGVYAIVSRNGAEGNEDQTLAMRWEAMRRGYGAVARGTFNWDSDDKKSTTNFTAMVVVG